MRNLVPSIESLACSEPKRRSILGQREAPEAPGGDTNVAGAAAVSEYSTYFGALV